MASKLDPRNNLPTSLNHRLFLLAIIIIHLVIIRVVVWDWDSTALPVELEEGVKAWLWWQKTNGTDKKESLRVWTKTNIAVHKKQVIEWWCVGQNWVTSLCHPPFPGSVALERISSSASSVQRPKRVPCFFAATRMSVSPLERIYGCPFSAPFACLPMHSTARGFVVVVGQKSFIHKMHPLVDHEIPIRKLLSSPHTNADQIVRVGTI